MTKGRGHAASGMAAIVSRLFLVLAIALFGAHHVVAERSVTHDGPAAAAETAFAPVILTAQSHLIRASVAEGDTPLATAPGSEIATPRQTLARVSWEPVASISSPAINILPHVRGPPAV
tara:strand:- start:221 stop:577 length:357 start_codon:yes stop_codon:yes gene_type:complete